MAEPEEINAVARPPIDPELHHSFADRLNVSKIADRNSCQPRFDPRAGLPVIQAFQPLNEWLFGGRGLVVTKFNCGHCNL